MKKDNLLPAVAWLGGLAGFVGKEIANAGNYAAITGEKYVGGLAGYMNGSKLSPVMSAPHL